MIVVLTSFPKLGGNLGKGVMPQGWGETIMCIMDFVVLLSHHKVLKWFKKMKFRSSYDLETKTNSFLCTIFVKDMQN